MNKILTLVLFGFYLQSFGQVADDFSDGDFSSNPAWQSDNLAFWRVINGQLGSSSTQPSSSFFIATPSAKSVNAQWEFFVNLQFNTSGANFVDVYLTSEQANPATAGNNGYFVRIGGTPDEVSLYKLTNGVASILVNGADGVTNTSNLSLKVKVIRTAGNVWTLERDVTGTGNNYVSEGSVTDNTFNTSNFFAIRITQSTASFHQKHFFDNIYVGNIIVESIPPTLENITVSSDTELTLTFSEAVEITSVETLTNYTVNNSIGHPIVAALQSDPKVVKLTFANPFTNGVENQLTITAVKDLVGNTITPASSSFRYFVPQPASASDLVINEIFPDPSPQIGLPAAEFIEIYNRSNKPFDLQNWKLSDPGSVASLPSYFLLPGAYVILTSSGAASGFTSYGNVIGLTNFPTLNNSGDAIRLTDATGLKIDSVNYSITWFQDADKEQGGWTLERLNPAENSNEPTNWLASIDASGGTPGKQNSVFGKNPDSKAPLLEKLNVVSSQELQLVFNEALNMSAAQIAFYSVDLSIGQPSAAALSSDLKTVALTFTRKFENGVDYVLSINGVADAAGNAMPSTEKPFRYFVPLPVNNKDVIITEIMADPTPMVQLPEAEYLEIFNRTDGPLDVGGWKLSDATTSISLPSKIILPKTYLILTATSNAAKFNGPVLGVPSFPSLNNDGESLSLRLGTVLIDSVNYSSEWYGDEEKEDGGWSLELIDLQNTCAEETNWIASENETGGTPGKINSVNANKPDVSGAKLLSVLVIDPQYIKLIFHEKLNNSLKDAAFTLSPSIGILSASFADRALREVVLKLEAPLITRTLYKIIVNNLRDCAGNVIDENNNQQEFALTEEAEPNDVLINELLFNPRSGGVDFVEIINHSDKYFNLKNWQLGNIELGELKNPVVITKADLILKPHALLAFTSDPSILANQYPAGNLSNFFKTGLPNLPDDEGSIALQSQSTIIDSLFYSENFHNPLLKDTEGISLERISTEQSLQVASNWQSATAQAGFATPGLINSNSKPETTAEENAIQVEPIIFSPTTDFAKINYSFDQPGQVATVRIIDAQGRLIKEVANNEVISYQGFFRWDGDQQNGSKARLGYYTVWVEVVDLSGTVKTFRKRVVITR